MFPPRGEYKYRNIDFVAQGCKDTEEIRNRSVSSLNGRILYGVIFVCNNKIYCPLKASPYDLSLDLLFLFLLRRSDASVSFEFIRLHEQGVSHGTPFYSLQVVKSY